MTLDRRFKFVVAVKTLITLAAGAMFASLVTLQMNSVAAQSRPETVLDYKIDTVKLNVEQLRTELERSRTVIGSNTDKINALQNEISTMRGFGIALSSIMGGLQVVLALLTRRPNSGG